METLTAQQALMALEYLAFQAAQDAPAHDADKHMWITRMQASIAIERQITEADWDALVAAAADYQEFDRDPAAFLHERGYSESALVRDGWAGTLEDQLSWKIDTAYACSGE